MIHYTDYPSGAVMCCFTKDRGAIIVVCRDMDVPRNERAHRARQEVERIIEATLPEHPKGAMIDERV